MSDRTTHLMGENLCSYASDKGIISRSDFQAFLSILMDLGLEPEEVTGLSSFEFSERNKWLCHAEAVAEATFPFCCM